MAIDFGRHHLQRFRHIYFRWWFDLGDVHFRFRISLPEIHGAMYCMSAFAVKSLVISVPLLRVVSVKGTSALG